MFKIIQKMINNKKRLEDYEQILRKHELLLQRIMDTTQYYKQQNCSISYMGFKKIEDLCKTNLYEDEDIKDENINSIIDEINIDNDIEEKSLFESMEEN